MAASPGESLCFVAALHKFTKLAQVRERPPWLVRNSQVRRDFFACIEHGRKKVVRKYVRANFLEPVICRKVSEDAR